MEDCLSSVPDQTRPTPADGTPMALCRLPTTMGTSDKEHRHAAVTEIVKIEQLSFPEATLQTMKIEADVPTQPTAELTDQLPVGPADVTGQALGGPMVRPYKLETIVNTIKLEVVSPTSPAVDAAGRVEPTPERPSVATRPTRTGAATHSGHVDPPPQVGVHHEPGHPPRLSRNTRRRTEASWTLDPGRRHLGALTPPVLGASRVPRSNERTRAAESSLQPLSRTHPTNGIPIRCLHQVLN